MTDLTYHFSYREKDRGWQVILSYKDQAGRWKQKSRQGLVTKKAAKAAGEKLLADGTDIKTVAALLGDTVTTVLNVYVDYTDDMRRKAAQSIEKIFA